MMLFGNARATFEHLTVNEGAVDVPLRIYPRLPHTKGRHHRFRLLDESGDTAVLRPADADALLDLRELVRGAT